MSDNSIKVSVFLSWSGYQSVSYEVAKILQKSLPDILQGLDPYFSKTDIGAGAAWLANLNEHLVTTDFAVFCLTQQNLHSQWMHYEAGAIMMHKDRTCPFLFCVDKKSLDSPLNYHQCVEFQRDCDKANKESFESLLNRLNEICKEKGIGISDERLKRQFNRIYNRDIKRALIRLSKKAKTEEENAKAETERIIADAQTQAAEIIEQAKAEAREIVMGAKTQADEHLTQARRHLSQTREHYNQALSDVEVYSRTWSHLASSAEHGNAPFSYEEKSRPNAMEIIMEQDGIPLAVSLGYLEHYLEVLSAFPPSVLKERVMNDENGKPDKGRWEVIRKGRTLIDALHGKKKGCDNKEIREFQKAVKEKLSIPFEDEEKSYKSKRYAPVSIKTIREALETVIRNITFYLNQEQENEKEAPT